MDLNLKGKVALVTGGSHGIGLAIAQYLAKEGCNISICARGKRYNVQEAAISLLQFGIKCHYAMADLSDSNTIQPIVDDTVKMFGRIDILVNNVGGGSSWGDKGCWEKTSDSVWLEVINTNLMSTLRFTNMVLPHMMKNSFGRVISISSIHGAERGGTPWFQTAKTAQISLMKSYSSNPTYVTNGITFNTVSAGYVDMPDKKQPDSLKNEVPMNRLGVVDDIAPIVTFLCSEKSSYINGANILVDGGYTRSF